MVSNRPALLEKSLPSYVKAAEEQAVDCAFRVVMPEAGLQQAQAILKRTGAEGVSEESFRAKIAVFAPDASFLFEGKYGGVRNIGLFLAGLDNSHCVFFDDDTLPDGNCLARYDFLFKNERLIIPGAYIGRTTAVSSIVQKLELVLTAYKDGTVKRKFAIEKLREAFQGLPDEQDGLWRSGGFRGGNLGINAGVAEKYCFFPTHYRIEDGLYGNAGRFFFSNPVYDPPSDDEYARRIPVVLHRPVGRKGAFIRNYIEGLRGVNIGACVLKALDQPGITEPELQNHALSNRAGLLKLFLHDAFLAAAKEKNFGELMAELGDKEVTEDYAAFLKIGVADIAVPDVGLQVKKFFDSQRAYPKLVRRAKEAGVFKPASK